MCTAWTEPKLFAATELRAAHVRATADVRATDVPTALRAAAVLLAVARASALFTTAASAEKLADDGLRAKRLPRAVGEITMLRSLLIVAALASTAAAQGGSAGGMFGFRSGGSSGGQPMLFAAPSGGSAGGYGGYQAYAAPAVVHQVNAPAQIRYLPVRHAIYIREPVQVYATAPSRTLGFGASFRIGLDY
jgi:hypothetical protein